MRAHASRICAIVLLCAIGLRGGSGAAAQQVWGLPQLMAALAQVKSATGQFTERKTMRMLTQPLVASGRLAYVAPSHIEKVTLSPIPERLVMDGDRVTIVSGSNNETHTFSIADFPQIGGLVEGIRATLAGDLPTLERLYTTRLSGTPAAWDLQLLPRNSDLAHVVKWIEFRGEGNRIQTIDTEDGDGDRSEMTIVEDGRNAR
jgi:outer membrane lipoprotein-sorting protein